MTENKQVSSEGEQPSQYRRATAVKRETATFRENWRNIRLITAREFKNQSGRRSFKVSTFILAVLVAIAAFIPTIIQLISVFVNSPTQLVIVNNAGAIAGMDESSLQSDIFSVINGKNSNGKPTYQITLHPNQDLNSLQSQVEEGKLDLLLVLERDENEALRFTDYSSTNTLNDPDLPKIQVLASHLSSQDVAYQMSLTSKQTQALFAAPSLTVIRSQGNRALNEIAVGYVLAFAGPVLIYIAGSIYTSNVAQGTVEEKSNRVMEVLLNSVTPLQLLVGKIMGIGAACLTQMGCVVIVGIGALLLQTPIQAALFGAEAGNFSQYLTSISIPFYLLFLLYFLLHFLLYSTIFAGLAANAKRQDEIASIVQVPTMLIVLGWLLVYVGVAYPNAIWFKVLSYIPLFSSMLMLVRLGLGVVAWWEIMISVLIMLTSISICAWFAARFYRLGVLMYGQRPQFRQMLRMVLKN